MKEFVVVFQLGEVEYLKGNHFYTSTIKKEVDSDETIHYTASLHDDVLIKKFGKHHDYYESADGIMNFQKGKQENIMDLHIPILKAIDKESSIS
jgi:hypothetical protein